METLRHVVCGTDFSQPAEQALELALELASLLTVVHVCELGIDELDDRRLQECSEALDGLVARVQRSRGGVTGVLRHGNPWEKLDNVAAEVGAGLIVVGRHGAGRGRRVAMGSVADQLVRYSCRPVLTVPHDLTRLDSEAFERRS